LHHRRIAYQSGGKSYKNDRFAATAHPARTSHSRRKASVCIDLKADKPLKTPVTMAAIKADKRLVDMALVKYSRLSVQPVTAEEWKIVCKMGGV
jgi:predicted RNA-binding protein with PUA-like domain